MGNYRRLYVTGGCYFFTVVCWQRRPIFAIPENVAALKTAFRQVMRERPFSIDAIAILPDHLHCLWRLPEGDDDFSGRWREIKKTFTRRVRRSEQERIWQPRFWEHWIRNEEDWRRHMDYIHYNPVKHGLAQAPRDWPFSSFRRAVEKGWYDEHWGESCPEDIADLDWE